MAQAIAGTLPGRPIHVVADAAYAGKELSKLPPGITWTTRLRRDGDRRCEASGDGRSSTDPGW